MNNNQPPTPQTITIGRAKDNTIVIEDARISRKHAKITVETDGSYFLEDLSSTDRIFVNGNKIKGKKVTLEDKVTFDNHEYLLEDLLIMANVIEKPKDPLDFTEEFAGLKVVYQEYSRFLKKRDKRKEKNDRFIKNLRIVLGVIGIVFAIFRYFTTGNVDIKSITICGALLTLGALIGEIVFKLDEAPQKEFESKWKCPKCGDDDDWFKESWAKMAAQKKCKKCDAIWVK
jgi:ribosome-associated protein YbcJ (S4-like RNA binding protein)